MAHQPELQRSIDKALMVLVGLQDMHCGARLSELTRRTGLAKSTVHRLLGALVDFGLVSRNGNIYQAATSCQGSCSSVDAERRNLLNDLAPFLVDLAARTGLTASLAVLHGTDVVFTHRVYGHQGVRTPTDDTGRAPAYRTSAGQLLLAYDSQTARHLIDAWGAATEKESRLTLQLLAIRRQHFAMNTTDNGGLCVAVPLHRRPDMPNVAFTLKGKAGTVEPDALLGYMRAVVSRAVNMVIKTPAATALVA
ncbi:IclR family transcriptional regulator [Lentzea sp. NPDC051213]|uniref:IclR family transcriptional regulator n=1 Tax=Lentzea sp. NPDC051213 TaxID=3364126 RepID=UPI00379FAAC5